jgi:hypothetical protein
MPASQKPQWRSTHVEGLCEFRPAGFAEDERGIHYSRYSVNGGRTSRSLETSNFEHAKIKDAKRMVDVEKDRPRNADLGTDFKTLGTLWVEMEQRLAQTPNQPARGPKPVRFWAATAPPWASCLPGKRHFAPTTP